MKVYMKKEDRDPLLPQIVFYLISFGLPALIIYLIVSYEGDILSALNHYSNILVFLGLPGLLDLYIIYALIKPPTKEIVVLDSINEEMYNGNKITYMVVGSQSKKTGKVYHDFYRCYTYESVDYKQGDTFELTIKEFNHKLLKLEKSDVFIEETPGDVSTIVNTPRVKIATFIFMIPFFIPSIICFYALYKYPSYWYVYLPIALLCAATPLSVLFLSRQDKEKK